MCDECLHTMNPNNSPACVRCGHLAREWDEIVGAILCHDCQGDIVGEGRPHARECDCEDCNIYDELDRIERREALKQDLMLGEIIERDISRIEQDEITAVMNELKRKGND